MKVLWVWTIFGCASHIQFCCEMLPIYFGHHVALFKIVIIFSAI